MAGKLAIEGAEPLRYNGYKVPLMRNLVKRAIRGVEEAKVGVIEWATSPWGQDSPHPYRVLPDLGGGHRRAWRS